MLLSFILIYLQVSAGTCATPLKKTVIIPLEEIYIPELPRLKHLQQVATHKFLNKKEIQTHEGNLDFPLALTHELLHSHYTGIVGFGTPPQSMRMLIDTGSTNVHLVSIYCKSPTCKGVNKFDPEKSKTFRKSSLANMNIDFMTASISVIYGHDTISLETTTLSDKLIGLITDATSLGGESPFHRLRIEGILGFDLSSNSVSQDHPSIFEDIMKSTNNMIHTFSFWSNPNAGNKTRNAALIIGDVDPSLYEGPLQYVPVLKDRYWMVDLKKIEFGDHKLCCDKDSHAVIIFDTGTTMSGFPKNVKNTLETFLPPFICEDTKIPKLPNLTYTLENDVKITLTPQMYLIHKRHTAICRPAFMEINLESQYDSVFVLGVTYFKHYFTVFDQSSPLKIGIAKPRPSKYMEAIIRQ